MNTEGSRPPANRQIIEEAAEWFVELNEGEADEITRQRFDAWLRLSPEHVRAYLKILPVWEEGSQLDTPEATGDPKALIAWARAGNNVVPLDLERSDADKEPVPVAVSKESVAKPAEAARRSLHLAIAACALIAIFGAWLYIQRGTYATGIGEQRLVTLSDGSTIELNSRSRLKVRLTEYERSIELIEGQALFRVAKDKTRPFTVRSGDGSVRAVGTQFDVYRKRTGTVVTVVEGRVALLTLSSASLPPHAGERKAETSSVTLSAGEQAILIPSAPPEPRRANVAIATAWTQQRLEFSRTPLAEVAEEFNRYNERQLVVKEGELKAFNVSGTFSSSDPASLVRFLRAQPGIKVRESASAILVSEE
jgi:transmembrane sensor